MNSPPGEIDQNLEKIETYAAQASEKGVDIICFPELSITGYTLENPKKLISLARSGEIIIHITETAHAHGLVIAAGTIELTGDEEKPYISQVVAGPDGLLGIYRKTHLSPAEKESYRPGHDITTFSHRDVIFGVQLCYETHFPEISTIMALEGAKIILMPHASPRGLPEEKLNSWLRHLPGRAFDNALFIVACNQVGKTSQGLFFPGVAVMLNPLGRTICRHTWDDEKMLLADLSMDELGEVRGHRMKYFLPHRRPELYSKLSAESK
jgi:N-carbamoylputrescine amidase